MNASTNTAQIVDFDNNDANKLAKSSRKASGKLTTASASDIAKGNQTAKTEGLEQRMESSAKTYQSIKKTQKGHLVKLKDIGLVLKEYRANFKSDKLFGQAIAETPLKVVSRQDRNDLMWLADNWDQLQELIENGDLSSRNPSGLRKQFKALSQSKTESTDGDPSLETDTESTTQDDTESSTPSESTAEQSSAPAVTETSVASDLVIWMSLLT